MSGGLYLFHRLTLELASVVHDGGEEWIGSARSVRYGFPRGSPLSSDYEAPRTLARISTLTGLPSVDRLLADDRIAALIRDHGRPLVLEAVRDALDEARAAVAAGGAVDRAEIEPAVATCVHAVAAPSLIPPVQPHRHGAAHQRALGREFASAITATLHTTMEGAP